MSQSRNINAQALLKSVMQQAGMSPRAGGLCYGVSGAALMAGLAGDGISFDKDVSHLLALSAQSSLGKIDSHLVDLLQDIEFFSEPSLYPERFPNTPVILQSMQATASYAKRYKLTQHGGLYKAGEASGIYSKNSLSECFSILSSVLRQQQITHPIGMLISDSCHTIAICYHPSQKQPWSLTNIESMPSKTDLSTDVMPEKIFKALQAGQHSAFSMTFYSAGKHAKTSNLFMKALLSKERWQQIHKPSDDNVSLVDHTGADWLTIAVMQNDIALATLLIANGSSLETVFPDNGMTPLLWAVDKGYEKMVELLLQYGANPNHQANDGRTALHIAMHRQQNNVARLLLESKANPHIKRFDDGAVPLYVAAILDQPKMVNLLLQYGANPNLGRDKGQFSPLSIAAGKGHKEVVAILLKHDPDLTSKTAAGFTAEQLAEQAGHLAIANLIRNHHSTMKQKYVTQQPGLLFSKTLSVAKKAQSSSVYCAYKN